MDIQAFMCSVCGYLYDVETAEHDQEGQLVSFDKLDPDWYCPVCGVRQDLFIPVDSDRVPEKPI